MLRFLCQIDLIVLALAFASDPAVPAPFPSVIHAPLKVGPSKADPSGPSIDQLIAQLATQRKAKEDAIKAEADTIAAIKALLAADVAKAAAVGISIEPPAPADPLTVAVQAAYTADPSVGKASDKRALAAMYRLIATALTTTDPTTRIDSTGVLAATIGSSTKATLSGRLSTITPIFGKDFAGHVPAGNVTLTDAQKTEVVAALTRYAAILDGVK